MARAETFERHMLIRAPLAKVFEFFSEPRNLALITPPAMGFAIVSCPDRRLREGDRIVYSIRVLRVPVRWVTRITEWVDGSNFADLQEKGPYRFWLHQHSFEDSPAGVRMTDTVTYELPFGLIGRLAGGAFVRRQLTMIFDYRESRISTIFDARATAVETC